MVSAWDWTGLADLEICDLAHGLERGIPVSPNHPAFQLSLLRRHGDMLRPDGGSAANELIVTGGHVGTHIDALAHVSHDGFLHGGIEAASVTSHAGFSQHGIDTFAPRLMRGVLLDVADALGVKVLEPGYEITVGDLEKARDASGVQLRAGDGVLIRSGWTAHWEDASTFLGQVDGAPGIGEAGAAWLLEHDITLAGAETIAFEHIAAGDGHTTLPVHRMFLVESGVHIIEVLNLDALHARQVHEFGLVVAPLKLIGATGSPLRPLALIA